MPCQWGESSKGDGEKSKPRKKRLVTYPLHGDLGRWEWDQCHLSGYMVAQHVYHQDQELHQHVHESK